MLDIEFLPESADEVDEELSGGQAGAAWHRWGAAAIIAVCVAAAFVARAKDGGAPDPSRSPVTLSASQGPVAPRGMALVLRGRPAHEPVTSVVVAGSATWVLQRDGLRVVRPGQPVFRLQFPAAMQNVGLVGDPAAHLVWLIARGLVQAYNTDTTQIVYGSQVPASNGAAAMDGDLFLVVDNSVFDVGDGVHRTILRLPGAIYSIAADPTRNRLLVAYQTGPSQVLAVQPRPHGPAKIVRDATIRSIKPSLGVADGNIWFAGYDTGDGVLLRLDPTTLRPAQRSRIDQPLEPGAQITAVGRSSIFVRGADRGDELRCVDATSGDEVQTWDVDGVVASTTGRAVLGTSFGAVQLDMAACRG